VSTTNEELSYEAYSRVRQARVWNTLSAVAGILMIGGVVFLHFHSEFDVSVIWSLIVLVLSLVGLAFMTDAVRYVGFKGQPKCPRCGEVIERGKLLDHDLPKQCEHCSLEIRSRKPDHI
jgi:protein-S-isoprenylcysteine O-methyltransferase Ste14